MKPEALRNEIQLLIAPLIDELMSAEARGESVDIEQMAARHPEYQDEILSTLQLLRSLDNLDDASIQAEQVVNDPRLRQIGDFQLIRELGRGGMGIVYEAEQLTVERRVAVKLLPFAALADPTRLQRFKNEVRAAGALHHPHIVPVFAVGVERGMHYFAMQLINGPSCETLLNSLRTTEPKQRTSSDSVKQVYEPGQFFSDEKDTVPDIQAIISTERTRSPEEYQRTVANWGVQAAEALAFAHENGVLHRDIKPGNLLLDERGQIWVADFGLARIEQDPSVTTSGDILGTLRYMAPEQATPNRVLVDHRADIYSLGATLYELLTLRPIYDEHNRAALLRQIATATPLSLSKLDDSVPFDLAIIISKAIAKDREDRFSSAQAFADELKRFVNGEAIKTHPPTLAKRLRTWSRRHPRWATSAVAACILSMLVAVAFLQKQQSLADSIKVHCDSCQAFLDSGNREAAEQQVSSMTGRVGEAWWVPRSLTERVRDLQNEVERRKRAYGKLTQFNQSYDRITANLHFSTDEQLPELSRRCLQAAAEFGLPAGSLKADPDFNMLTASEQSVTKQKMLEILFIVAVNGLAKTHASEAEKIAACEAAIELFSQLQTLTRPFPGAKLWTALAYELMGSSADAKVFRDEATHLASQTSFEWFTLGEYQHSQRDYASATESFETALQRRPEAFLVLMSYAKTLRLFGGENSNISSRAVSHARSRQIEALCTGALAVHPHAISAYVTRAWARMDQLNERKGKLAKEDLKMAESIAPNDHRLIVHRAMFAGRQGKSEECLAIFREAEAIAPSRRSDIDYWHAHWLILADEYSTRREETHRQAIQLLSRTLDSLPSSFVPGFGSWYSRTSFERPLVIRCSALLRRAWLSRQFGDDAGALGDFEEIARTPVHSETQRFYVGLAQLLFDDGDQSTTVFDELDVEKVSRPRVSEELIVLQRSLNDGKVEFVMRMLHKLPETLAQETLIGREWAVLLDKEGMRLIAEGSIQDAIPYIEKAIELAPAISNFHFRLGTCHRKLGNHEAASTCYAEAIQLDPNRWSIFASRALNFLIAENYSDALSDADIATELDPEQSVPFTLRAEIFAKQSRWKEAVAQIKMAMERSRQQKHARERAFRVWQKLAPQLVLSGQKDLYIQSCRDLVVVLANDDLSLPQVEKFTKSCLLLPETVDIEELPSVKLLADIDAENLSIPVYGWTLISRAIVALRSNDLETASRDAETVLAKANGGNPRALALAILTLVQLGQGDVEECRETLEESTLALEGLSETDSDVMSALVLIEEARAKLTSYREQTQKTN